MASDPFSGTHSSVRGCLQTLGGFLEMCALGGLHSFIGGHKDHVVNLSLSFKKIYLFAYVGGHYIIHSGQVKGRGQLCGVDSFLLFCECCVSSLGCQLSVARILSANLP